MTVYIVEPATQIDVSALPKDKIRDTLKGATQDLLDLVQAFASTHPKGDVTVQGTTWITPSVVVETTPELIQELAKVSGIGRVTKSVDVQATLGETQKPAAPKKSTPPRPAF